jgi:electron transfer flavoprotein beta subunit
MKLLVAVKRVLDAQLRPRVKTDGSGVDLSNLKKSMNPFDEIALEEAIRLKEKGLATEVVAVSIGPAKAATDILKNARAMGADRAILIETDADVEPLAVAKLLAKVTQEEAPDMVLLGKQAIDDDCNQTGQMLAALLGWAQGTFASEIVIDGGDATVTREVDGGLETLRLKLPAVVTTDLRLNEPRYPTLPNIMKAGAKPLQVRKVEELGVDVAPRLTVLKVVEPPKRQAGIRVGSVDELIGKLKNLGVVA